MTTRQILLVSPGFHDYCGALAEALAARGHRVRVHRYDLLRGPVAKARHKVLTELPQRLGREPAAVEGRRVTDEAVAAVRAARPDVVCVVKGDLLGDDFYAEIDRLPRVLWLYDELRRTRWADRDLAVAGPICSYSRPDAARLAASGLPAHHLPLAYDVRRDPSDRTPREDEVVLVGARYPRRERVLDGLRERGVAVRAYGRDWSDHPADRARTWRLRSVDLPAGRDLPRSQAYRVMAAARAVLNVHGDQEGFTMRTFEAGGVGGLHLIDRRDLEGLYDDGVDLVSWCDVDELADLCRRAVRDPAWAQRIRDSGRRRTLAEHTFDHRAASLERWWGRDG